MTNSTAFVPFQVLPVTATIVPFIVVFGWITNTMNIYVLTRPSLLRSSTCTKYFLALSIYTLIYIIFGPLIQFVHYWYPLQASIPMFGCPVISYMNILTSFEILVLLVLASTYRNCASSSSATVRSWSSIKIAQRAIIISTITLSIMLSPYLFIWHSVYERGSHVCAQKLDSTLQVITMSQTAFFTIVCPLALVVFGILTIRNIRTQRSRRGMRNRFMDNLARRQRTECELCWMLLLQIWVYLLSNFPLTITYTSMIMISKLRTHFLYVLLHALYVVHQCSHFFNFFLYIFAGSIYRREVVRMLYRRYYYVLTRSKYSQLFSNLNVSQIL